jgi:hypothetical protein
MKNIPKIYIIIAVAVLVLVLLLSIRNCTNNNQDRQSVVDAVAQSKIDNLQNILTEKDSEITSNKQTILSLYNLIRSKDSSLYLKDKKIAHSEAKLSIELKKNHGLTDEESIIQFMDNSGYSDSTVTKYENRYNVPICAIRFYNDVKSNLDMQTDVNSILVSKIKDQEEKALFLGKVIEVKDEDISLLTDKGIAYEGVIAEKDKQIVAEHKMYKQQKVKTWVTGGIGVILLTLAIIY